MSIVNILLFYWLPTILWSGLIFFISSLPNLSTPFPEFKMSDKLAHFLVFGVLAILTRRSLTTVSKGKAVTFFSVMFASLYGLSDEFHQSLVPGRNASVWDVVADVLGAIAFLLIYNYWCSKKRDVLDLDDSKTVDPRL